MRVLPPIGPLVLVYVLLARNMVVLGAYHLGEPGVSHADGAQLGHIVGCASAVDVHETVRAVEETAAKV